MANPNDNLRRLYQNGLKHFSLPDFDTFQQDMKDEQKRRRFYSNMQQAYELPDFDTFSTDIGAVAPPAPAQPAAQAQQHQQAVAPAVRPINDTTAQQATAESGTMPAQSADWAPSPMQQRAFQMDADAANARFEKQGEDLQRLLEGMRKGNKPGAFLGEREFNPQTGQMETAYYTAQGERVSTAEQRSRANTEYHQWWENNTEAGRRSREQRLQREFEDRLSGLWQRHNPAEGENAAEQAWSSAQGRQKVSVDRNAERNWGGYAAIGGGREMRVVSSSMNRQDDLVDQLGNFDLDRLMNDSWDNLGEEGQKALIDDCYKMLRYRYPGADELELYNYAGDFARQQSDLRLYNLAVEKNRPQNELEYLRRKIGDMNLLMNVSKGLAVSQAKTTGDMAAYEAANEGYRQDGHKILDVAGTVAGFALDPTAWLSAGVGGAAAKGAMWVGGRFLAGRGASAAVSQAAARQFATTMTGRIVGGVAGGAANFGTFEGIKEIESQFAHGGKVATMDEDGNLLREGRYVDEGYSASAVGGQLMHGLGMGAAIGWLGPVTGNVSDKLVRGGGKLFGKEMPGIADAYGKAGARAGLYAGATVLEGTIFSVPEWIEGKRDGFDVWTDNMAMMAGFKAKHMLKSAGSVLGDLKASFESPANGRKNRLDFESRLRMRMDAPSDGGLALTKDEQDELSRHGYGDLRDLVESAERTGDASRGELISANAPEIVSRLTDMVRDARVSEAARAKMYYYATGRKLSESPILRGELFEDGNGGFIVESQGANGVITSRSFASRKAADLELGRIKRQAELNSIELGERFQQTLDFESRLQDACRTVAGEYGWDVVEVYRTCQEARRNHLRGGDKQFDEAQQNILRKVTDAMGEFEETGVTDAIRGRINDKYGVDIDTSIRKDGDRRTQTEQSAIDEYIGELIPNKAKANPIEDVMAEDVTNQKLLSDAAPGNISAPPGGEKPVGRAVMKFQDRPVEVLSGNVIMTEDGTMVDNERSDATIVIRDLSTGEIEMVSPEAILSYEEYPETVTVDEMEGMQDGTAAPEPNTEPQSRYTSGQIKIRNSDGTETRGVLTGYVDENGNHEYYVEGDLQHLHYASEHELDNILSEYQPDEPQQPSAEQPQAAERVYPEGVTDTEAYDNGLEDGAASTSMSDEELNNNIARFSDESEVSSLTDYGRGWVEGLKQEQQRRIQAAQPEQDAPIEPTPAPAHTPEPTAAPTPEPAQALSEEPQGDVSMPAGVNPVGTISVPQRDGSTRTFTVGKDAEDNNIVVDDRGFMWAHDGNGNAMQPYSPGANVPTWTDEQLSKLGAVQSANEQPSTVPNQPENVPTSAETPQNPPGKAVSPAESVPNPAAPVENEQKTPAPTAEPTPLQRIPRDAKGEPIFEQAENPEHGWDALVEFAEGDAATAKEIADTMAEEKRKAYEKAQKQKPKGKTPTEILASKKAISAGLAQAEQEYNLWQQMANVEQRRQDAIRAQQEAEARQRAAERAEAEKAEREAREEAARLEREALEGIPEWHMDTPENARKRGVRRFSGQMYQRQEPVQGVVGNEVEVKFSQKDLPKGRVAVIEASQLQPSHVQGLRNPMFFIDEAQPKNRAEAVSMSAAKEIAEGIRPQEITGSATAYTGAPTVNARGEVIQGNNRSDALRFLWENKLPQQQQTYKQYLLDNAEQFGIDPEAVKAMQQPVLVNMLDVDDAEAIRLGQMTAQDTESGGIERIKPKNVAQKLGDEMRTFANRLLSSGDDEASFGQLVDSNGTDVLKWMAQKGAITSTQYQSAFDSKGDLTAEAKNDLQKVLYQAVFKGGSQQLEEMFDKLPTKAQRAILGTAFRDMASPFAGKMLPEIQSSIMAYNLLMNDPAFAEAKNLEQVLRAISAFKSAIALDDRFEQYMPADNFSNFALQLAGMYKASDMSQTTIASYFNQMYDLAQGKKAATLFEEADTTEYPLAEVIKKVLNIDYQPAKNGNNNVANGGADVALRNQASPGVELRGSEPPASGEQNTAGTEPSERGAGTAGDSRGSGNFGNGGESEAATHEERLTKEAASGIIAKMEMSAVTDPKISLSPESWQNSFGLSNSIDTPLGKVKMGEGQYQKLVDKKRSAEFGMVVQTLQDPDVVFIEPSEAKEGQATERGFSYVFVKAFIRDGKKFKYYTSVSVLKDGMEVSVSSHIASKTAILKKLQGMERAYTKETLLPNSSEWHLAEHPSDVPDLLPTQGKSEISERKVTNFASYKQAESGESSAQPSDNKGAQTIQSAVETASAEVNTAPTPAQVEAGNYKKGHVTIGEFDITIENPAGSTRKGVDANGKEWSTTMANAYGYIKGTEGVDGDHIDVFLHQNMDEWNGRKVYVVDQTNTYGSFDEHKVMLGFNDKEEAMSAYLANYDATWEQTHPGLRISETNIEDFNKWVQSSHRKTKPFADYKNINKEVSASSQGSVADYSTVSKVTEQHTSSTITGKGYKVEPKPYTNKQSKTLDTYLVTFDRDFSKEELSTLRAKAKALKGWYDRETRGWMLRSADDAKAFAEDVVSGEDFRGRIEAAERSIERNNAELQSMSARDGVPFQFTEELAKAEEKLSEYEDLMKAEMAAKEAKYAEMDKDVEAASNIELTEEDSEDAASEPIASYSEENANFAVRRDDGELKVASRYETQDGKTINYTSENSEGYGGLFDFDFIGENAGGNEVGMRSGANDLQRQGDTGLNRHNSRLDKEAGEFSLIERVFRESGSFNFTSGEKIESADDVAFIFSALEDAAKEHSFVVLVKDGKPPVVELGMGTFPATMVDIPTASLAYNRIRPDQVYFVHNHPSGNLMCSPQDVQMLKKIGEMSDVPVTGVIINLKTGKYGTFDTNNNSGTGEKRTPEKENALTVHTLDKQIFAPDYDPMAQPLVRGSEDVAKFLNSQRMGDRAKMSFIILSRAGRIVGNIHTPFTKLPTKSDEIARYISERVIQFGGESAILYGDFTHEGSKMVAYRNLKDNLNKVGGTTLLDVVNVEGNNTRSANDDGLLYEPGSEYGASPDSEIRYREVEDDAILTEFAEGKTVKAYRTMQVIDGRLYSPMATKVGGKTTPEIRLGVPEQSEEHPEIIKGTKIGRDGVEQGYVVIDKGLGKGTLTVAYNPYAHTSRTVLNDQFSAAYIRPNLVTVEVEVPESELTSGYRAHMAKDAVGEISWHSGSVSGQLAELGRPRRVILTRYDRPVRIVPFREVAQMIAAQLDGTDIAIPYNVVQPQLRTELERLGVAISEEATGTVTDEADFGKAEYVTDQEIERINARQQEMAQTSPEAKSSYAERMSKKFNTPIRIVADAKELTSDNAERQARMRKSKGFYAPATGEVVIVIPNNANVEDVAETVFHEVVAHKGLREMIGEENYDAFCDEVYDHLKDDLKEQVDEETTRRFMNEPGKGYAHARRVAVDELLGRMAEKGFEDFTKAERGIWAKLKAKVLEAINKFLGALKLPKWVRLGDNELRYMLWRSHEKLRSRGSTPNEPSGMDYVDMARDAVKREELGLDRIESVWEREGYANIEVANKRFNEELTRYQNGEMKPHEILHLGYPRGAMRNFLPNLPIVMRQRVIRKGSEKKHDVDVSAIMNMPNHLASPIFIFQRSEDTIGVLTDMKDRTGKNVCVAIELKRQMQNGDAYLEVNDVRSFHGRDFKNIVEPIVNNHTLRWVDKSKGLAYLSSASQPVQQEIDRQVLEDAAKVIKNFENPLTDDDLRFRTVSNGAARREYDERVRTRKKENPGDKRAEKRTNHAAQLHEAYMDGMRSLRVLQEAVSHETGSEIESHEDAYEYENQLSSRNKSGEEEYKREYMKPMFDAIAEICSGKEHKRKYGELIDYVLAKHGLERNAFMRAQAIANGVDSDKADATDYAGLTALTGEQDVADAEIAAAQMVRAYEAAVDTSSLWKTVNAATKAMLTTRYTSGLLSRDMYDTIRTQYKNYIPLKGWEETVAADVYEYTGGGYGLGSALMKAYGRSSVADDPFATIVTDAQRTIMEANRNIMKQRFLNLALNHQTDLLTVNKQWYVRQANGSWLPDNPVIPADADADLVDAIVKQHEADMLALESVGDATKRRAGLQLGLNTVQSEPAQHMVKVKRNGEEFCIYVNGDPRAARAINGMLNPDAGEKTKIAQLAQEVKNFMSRAFTTWNPEFIVGNLSRDLMFAGTAVTIKEDARYARKYAWNITNILAKASLPRLLSKWEKGILDDNVDIERYFKEFLRNGGETGFTQLNTVDKVKKEMQRFLREAQGGVEHLPKKAWRSFWNGVEFMNRAAEDTTRFGVYMTSRQSGRTISRSISDAKEITVNFNRKGSGAWGARQLNFLYVFFNACMQAMANAGRLVKNNPVKSSVAMASFLSAGFLVPMVSAIFASLFGDEEDDYWNLPEWVRRNNICIYVPFTKKWLTIPIAHELRPFYGIGEIAYSTMNGKETTEDAVLKGVESFSGIMPIDWTGNGGDNLVNFAPTIVQPLVQVERNVDYFGKPIYKKTPWNENYPEWSKAYKGTNGLLVDVSKMLSEAGATTDEFGVTSYPQHWYSGDINPAIVEHLLESYSGGVGKTVNGFGKTISMLWNEDARELRNVPVVRKFLQSYDERAVERRFSNEYFKLRTEYEDSQQYYRKLCENARQDSVLGAAGKISKWLESEQGQRHMMLRSYMLQINRIENAIKQSQNEEFSVQLRERADSLKKELVQKAAM